MSFVTYARTKLPIYSTAVFLRYITVIKAVTRLWTNVGYYTLQKKDLHVHLGVATVEHYYSINIMYDAS